jgi:hypothetical protein
MEAHWEQKQTDWLAPFLDQRSYRSRRRGAPVSRCGLIGLGERMTRLASSQGDIREGWLASTPVRSAKWPIAKPGSC